MKKKIFTIMMLVFSIIFVSFLLIRATYSLIINVTDNNEIIGVITIRELITDDNGIYKREYYNVMSELDADNSEMDTLINSVELNKLLNKLLINVVGYRLDNKNKYSNDELYDLIITAINDDKAIKNELKDIIILKIKIYIQDIADYLYDIKTNKEV